METIQGKISSSKFLICNIFILSCNGSKTEIYLIHYLRIFIHHLLNIIFSIVIAWKKLALSLKEFMEISLFAEQLLMFMEIFSSTALSLIRFLFFFVTNSLPFNELRRLLVAVMNMKLFSLCKCEGWKNMKSFHRTFDKKKVSRSGNKNFWIPLHEHPQAWKYSLQQIEW